MSELLMIYIAADSKHNTTQSINIIQQIINAVGTEYQQTYNSYFPLTANNNCIRSSSAIFKIVYNNSKQSHSFFLYL